MELCSCGGRHIRGTACPQMDFGKLTEDYASLTVRELVSNPSGYLSQCLWCKFPIEPGKTRCSNCGGHA